MKEGSPEGITREEPTALAKFVRERLTELHIRQTEFCRQTGFDQGLLSKIQNSIVSTLSLESALRLAVGMRVRPQILLTLIGRPELNELVLKAYGRFNAESGTSGGTNARDNLEEVRRLVERAHSLGKDLAPIKKALHSLIEDRTANPRGEQSYSMTGSADLAPRRV
jgi:transcriptional regulator with XRE-family HTH domain